MKNPRPYSLWSISLLCSAFIASMTILAPATLIAQGVIPGHIAELKKQQVFKEGTKLFTLANHTPEPVNKVVSTYTTLEITGELSHILAEEPAYLSIDVPFNNGRKFRVLLYRVSISPDGLTILNSAPNLKAPRNKIVHYRGSIDNDANSVASFTFSESETMGMICNHEGNYVLGKIEKNKDGLFIFYNDRDLLVKNNIECGNELMEPTFQSPVTKNNRATPELPASTGAVLSNNNADPSRNASAARIMTSKCVNWYWETDYDVFVSKGSLANVNAYIQGIFNQVSTLYSNDGIGINLRTLYVWTTADPYSGPSTANYLSQFGTYRTSWNGDLAHLIGFQGNGGQAYLNGIMLCEYSTGQSSGQTGFSGVNGSYSNVPTYSWTVECIAHEQGHQLGSNHTHACVWNGNNTKIDDCGGAAGYTGGTCLPQPNPVLPVAGGTIMSYCHLTSAGINFINGFGPQPRSLITGKINASTCLSTCNTCSVPAQPGAVTGSISCCSNSTQTYSIPAVTGASSYTWTLPSGWTGTSTTTSITATTFTTGGTITVKANNSCGSSAAQSLTVTVNATPGQPGVISGSSSVCPGSTQTYSVTTVSGASSYTWTLPPGWTGTSTTNTITATTGASGGTITVKANSSCGSSAIQALAVGINTTPPPQPALITGNSAVCPGSIQAYTVAAVTGATSYTWTLPTGWTGTSTTNSISTTAGATGGSITVRANSNCLSSTAQTLSVSINPAVPAQPGLIAGPTTLCPGSTQTYSVPVVPGATSYTWGLPTGWTGTSITNSIVARSGSAGGTISVRASNSCGNSVTQTLSITVISGVPAQPGAISTAATTCANSTATFSVSPVAGATSYTWILPAGWSGSSSANSITTTTGATGGTVSVKAGNGCTDGVARTLVVAVSSTPAQPGIVTGDSVVYPALTKPYSIVTVPGATSYTWVLPPGWLGSSSLNTIAAYTGINGGNIAVKANNSCGSGTSRFFPVRIGILLPVSLLNFTGRMEDQTVALAWTTSQEINCERFEVERSFEGSAYSAIGNVPAQGISNYMLHYGFIDQQPYPGISYYRLKIIDRDGHFSYSNTIVINNTGKTIVVRNLYPNPAHENITIESVSAVNQALHIRIYDATGKKIMAIKTTVFKGINQELFSLTALTPGIYHILFNDASDQLIYRTSFTKL